MYIIKINKDKVMNDETIFDSNQSDRTVVTNNDSTMVNNPRTTETMLDDSRATDTMATETKSEERTEKKSNKMKFAGFAAAGVAGVAAAAIIPTKMFAAEHSNSKDVGVDESDFMGDDREILENPILYGGHELEVAENVDDSMSYEEAFNAAREEVGPGGMFVWNGNTYATYYVDEWNELSPEEQEEFKASASLTTDKLSEEYEPEPDPEEKIEDESVQEPDPHEKIEDELIPEPEPHENIEPTDLSVATGVDDSMSFSEAFAAARAEVGPGGIFTWHGQEYGTYYKDEWDNMTAEEKDEYWASVNHTVQNDDINNSNNDPGYGNIAEGQTPQVEPTDPVDPIEPEPVEEPLYVDENNVYMNIDVDGDGVNDISVIDINDNGIADYAIDTDLDGKIDAVIIDPTITDEGKILADNIIDVNGMEVVNDDGYNIEVNEGHAFELDCDPNPDIDGMAMSDFESDIPIDNNIDMDDYI